jgi:hypothetical protein
MFKFASLAAATGLVASANAWSLTLSANETWQGNDASPAGGLYTFDNTGNSWNNGTGTCTVTSASEVSFLSGSGLFTYPSANPDSATSFKFADLMEDFQEMIQFLVFTDLNGEELPEDFLSVDCESTDVAADDSVLIRSFPNHPEEAVIRGSVRKTNGNDWGNFVLSFPDGVVPANLTFDDPNVFIGEELNGAVSLSAEGATSDELWFQANWQGDARMAGSWEMSVANVE